MEYHKTKDILHVMRLLGHKNIKNTLIYTQLVTFQDDDFVCKTAENVKEAKELIEAGYISEAKTTQEDTRAQTSYKLKPKAYLAMLLKENTLQDILEKATDTQAASILLSLLNVLLSEKDQNEEATP